LEVPIIEVPYRGINLNFINVINVINVFHMSNHFI